MEAKIVQTLSIPRSRGGAAIRASFGMFAAASVFAAAEHPARACGGCFSPPRETTVVTDHRMAFSLSTRQTVLWDQIKYSGNPSEFSWVLPVRPGAVVQLSNDEWFATLDAMTSPVITGPLANCGGGSGVGCGGGFGSANSAALSASGGPEVQVISQSVVGPYDTATLQSTDPTALDTWLTGHGYATPDSIRPTIAAYVAEGFDFIALRLSPGAGVQSMQPVRVVTPSADATLPLRMVAAGVGAQVDITLYVISEGRYEAASPFYNAVVDESQLRWFQTQFRSNYQELSLQLMLSHAARTWLTEFSGPTSLLRSQSGGGPLCNQGSVFPGQSLADVYFGQCHCKAANHCAPALPSDAALAPVVDDGSAAASDDASDDASLESGGGDAPTGSASEAGCNPDPCSGFDDIDVALVGIHPQDSWVTRLRAVLPVAALSAGDLHIQASASQAAVSNQHTVSAYDDPNYRPCGTKGGCSASATQVNSFEKWLVAGTFGLAGVALLRRRRRASGSSR